MQICLAITSGWRYTKHRLYKQKKNFLFHHKSMSLGVKTLKIQKNVLNPIKPTKENLFKFCWGLIQKYKKEKVINIK